MAQPLGEQLQRWREAGLIDSATADRISVFEASQQVTPKSRWPTVLALTAGGLMLAAGMLLFVAANWDRLSPTSRFLLSLLLVAGFHLAAAYSAEKSRPLSVTLSAVGTAALGAGIFLAGQVFNLESHWPTAILLWAVGAWAGYVVLRQWPQAALAAVLTPFWLVGEWMDAHSGGMAMVRDLLPAAGCLHLALVYLAAERPSEHNLTRKALAWIGGLAVIPAALITGLVASDRPYLGTVPTNSEILLGFALTIGLPLLLAFWLRGRPLLPALIAALWVALSLGLVGSRGVIPYLWGVAGAVGLVIAGVREPSARRINLGVSGFAIVVMLFYFSTVMDRLGRSASLMLGGVLFLLGGWALDRARRRLLSQVRAGEAA
jgi:uncharacterized membrane protein